MRQFVWLIFSLIVCFCCTLPSVDKIQQNVELQVKLLVDSGYIQHKYVYSVAWSFNDSNYLYLIADSDYPMHGVYLECPSKIISYKDKYLCFKERDKAGMSIDEMRNITNYSGDPIHCDEEFEYRWILVMSNQGERKKLINIEQKKDYEGFTDNTDYLFDRIELWPYLSGYVKHCPIQIGLVSHNVEIYAAHLEHNVDSLNLRRKLLDNIKGISGIIYLRNNTDSTVCLSSDSQMNYAIAYGKDTLYLSSDSTISLKPYQSGVMHYHSIPNSNFWNKLRLEKDPWGHFHQLFSKSAYCLMDVNCHKETIQMMYFNDNTFFIYNERGDNLFRIVDYGIDDEYGRSDKNSIYWGSQKKVHQ